MHLEGNKPTSETTMDSRDLTCPVCMCIAEEPQISSCCQRVFCQKDADPDRYTNGCPLCREKNFTFRSSPKHKEMLDQLTIKCACAERVSPEEYEHHLERCTNVSFTCPHKVCQDKNDTVQYNSQQLISHLARAHCDEVPLLGSTYVNKKSVESYKKASGKYDDLVSTLYCVLYPKMIDMQIKNASSKQRNSAIFKCPEGHKLIEADHTKRKRKNGLAYASAGYNCDVCHRSYSNGLSWHCSCTDTGFDKCVACFVFQLYDLNDSILKLANKDKEKQQQRYRRETIRNIVRLPHGLFRLLTRTIDHDDGEEDEDDDDDDDDDNDDDDDLDLLALRHQSTYLAQQNQLARGDNEAPNAHRHED